MGQQTVGVRNTARMKIPTTLVSSFAVVLFAVGCGGGGAPANMPEAPAVPSGVPAAGAIPEVPSAAPAVPAPPAAPAVPSGVPAARKK